MKPSKNFLLASILIATFFQSFPQSSPPESISYQGIARDASGNILSNQPIGIQFIIHQGATNGSVVFSESHSTTTNTLGLFSLQIGSVNTATFQTIPWQNGPYYLEVQMDPTGGTSYTSIGTQQLLSVPYALYAKNSYSAASSFTSVASYTTMNAPPIAVTTNTSSTSTTLNISQGTNSTSAVINFPPPPSPTITINSSGIASVSPTSGSNFTVDVPTPTLNPGTGISITNSYPNYTVINTAPDQNVSIASGTNVIVNSTYPNFTVNATPTLSISGNTLSISGGNTIAIPASNVTLNPIGIVSITPSSGNNFSVTVPAPTIAVNTNTTTGVSTLTLIQGSATSTASIPSPTNYAWGLSGNTVTTSNFLGTTNNQPLVFKTNNTEKMRIDTGGNVGVSETVPMYKLSIKNLFSTGGIQLDNQNGHGIYIGNNSGSGNALYAWNSNVGNGDASIYAYSSNSVAPSIYAYKNNTASGSSIYAQHDGTGYGVYAASLGTGSAIYAQKPGVSTAGSAGVFSIYGANNWDPALFAETYGSGPAGRFIIANPSNTISPVLHVWNNTTSSAPLAIFQGNGNVGIGTTAPQSFLHVSSPNSSFTKILQLGNGNQPGSEWIFDVDGISNLRIVNENTLTPSYMYFGANDIIGLNTSTPIGAADFVVSYNTNHTSGYSGMYVNSSAAGLPFYGYAKGNSPTAWTYLDASNTWILNNGGTDRLFVNSAGNVGINVTPPSSKLHVEDNANNYVVRVVQYGTGFSSNGILVNLANFSTPTPTANYFIGFATGTSGGTIRGAITGNNSTGVQYTTASDKRLKENIKDFTGALSVLEKMEPKVYNFIGDNHIQHGFLAQDLQKIYPEAVSGSPDGDPKQNPMMIDYSKLTPVLTASIKELLLITKEQQKQIEELKKEIQHMKDEISILKSK